jgi:iron complex outermembrane receptor protein
MLDFNFTKSFRPRPDRELKLSVFASNLLDEAARNHTSYIKNEVPLPGRNVGIRLQTVF